MGKRQQANVLYGLAGGGSAPRQAQSNSNSDGFVMLRHMVESIL